MLETATALLLAHAATDFLFKTNGLPASRPPAATLILHAVIVLVASQAALGRVDAWEPLAIAAAYLAINTVTAFAMPARLWAFLLDQAAHVTTLLAVAFLSPGLFAGGLWAGLDGLPAVMALGAGGIIATAAGGQAVALLVDPWDKSMLPEGLPNGGRLIGLLERGIIYLLIIVGQPAGIGFLIAAKSVLRFETASKDQRAGEYVIVGTLASFGWAMVAGWATLALVSHLPPIGILPQSP